MNVTAKDQITSCSGIMGNYYYYYIIIMIIIHITTLVNVYVDLVVFTRIAVFHRPEVVDIGVNTI